jgi:MoaA/NifB/PqqE/SkfB family radical SAM enzyme|tara:strand:- start:1111 stop:2292 length:1182 start_codon:yes stop_codon:yes gene_type:complete
VETYGPHFAIFENVIIEKLMIRTGLSEYFRIWNNVYRRIRFFKKMYPLSAIVKDMFLFPIDYANEHRFINKVRNVTIAITHKCNIRCEMCYFHDKPKNTYELPMDLYRRIIDSVKSSNPCIILSGGEPFTHPNLLEMVIYAKKMHLPVQIFTNGTLVQPAIADSLVEHCLDYIDFTLLGDEKSHSQVARSPKAYQMLIENLEYFAGHRGNIQIILNYTVTPENIKDIEHSVELVRLYKLDGLRIQHYNFLLPEEFEKQECVMSELFGMESSTHEIENMEDVSGMTGQLVDFQNHLYKEFPDIPVQWAPTLTASEIGGWYSLKRFRTQRKCFYPWRGLLVDASGKIYPCSKIYLELGDMKGQDIFKAWNSSKMKKFRSQLKKGLFPACSRCCKL